MLIDVNLDSLIHKAVNVRVALDRKAESARMESALDAYALVAADVLRICAAPGAFDLAITETMRMAGPCPSATSAGPSLRLWFEAVIHQVKYALGEFRSEPIVSHGVRRITLEERRAAHVTDEEEWGVVGPDGLAAFRLSFVDAALCARSYSDPDSVLGHVPPTRPCEV